LTLYVTPVVYTYLDDFQKWLGRRRSADSRLVTAITE